MTLRKVGFAQTVRVPS